MTLLIIAITFALILIYGLYIRPILRTKEWAAGYFKAIEPIERTLWLKSETILIARAKMVTGLLLTLLTQLKAIDITPIMPLVPERWQFTVTTLWNCLPLTLTILGWVDEQLRKDTTKPIEVVALPDEKTTEVAAAVAKVEEANAEVKAVVAAEATKGG